MSTLEQRAAYDRIVAQAKAAVKQLGDQIGYGLMMQLTHECWREAAAAHGLPPGSAHTCGPCADLTVPCGCNGGCNWCEGCGWLTQKVKEVKDAQKA
jgi:hypothetical protein